MTVSLTLFVSASAFVRLVSVPVAVIMCAVAAVIPPIAAISANRWDEDDHWWDEPAPGAAKSEKRPEEPGPSEESPPSDEASPGHSGEPSSGADAEDAQHPSPRSQEEWSFDELLWEEELRGYGERF